MTKKERIENLEREMAAVQAGLQDVENRLGTGFNEILTAINNLRTHHPKSPPSPPRSPRREGELLADPNIVYRPRKMDFPRFTGDDPMEIEQNNILIPRRCQRIDVSQRYLENEANHWWQWLRRLDFIKMKG